jgi:hypothetical protein
MTDTEIDSTNLELIAPAIAPIYYAPDLSETNGGSMKMVTSPIRLAVFSFSDASTEHMYDTCRNLVGFVIMLKTKVARLTELNTVPASGTLPSKARQKTIDQEVAAILKQFSLEVRHTGSALILSFRDLLLANDCPVSSLAYYDVVDDESRVRSAVEQCDGDKFYDWLVANNIHPKTTAALKQEEFFLLSDPKNILPPNNIQERLAVIRELVSHIEPDLADQMAEISALAVSLQVEKG